MNRAVAGVASARPSAGIFLAVPIDHVSGLAALAVSPVRDHKELPVEAYTGRTLAMEFYAEAAPPPFDQSAVYGVTFGGAAPSACSVPGRTVRAGKSAGMLGTGKPCR